MLIVYKILINFVFFFSPIIIVFRIFKGKEDILRFKEKIGFFSKKRNPSSSPAKFKQKYALRHEKTKDRQKTCIRRLQGNFIKWVDGSQILNRANWLGEVLSKFLGLKIKVSGISNPEFLPSPIAPRTKDERGGQGTSVHPH